MYLTIPKIITPWYGTERHYDDYPSIQTSMFIIVVTIVDRCLKDSD